jgi:hypothetical protein
MGWSSNGVLQCLAETLAVNPDFGQVQFDGIFGSR